MTWPEFLEAVPKFSNITLVGPLHNVPHEPLRPTIYIDGGTRWRTEGTNHFPVVSVGDGDSSPLPLDKVLPAEKDHSDLAFVLTSLPASITTLELLGFLGGRHDHELANLGEIHRFLKSRASAQVKIFGGDREVTAINEGRVALKIQGTFSVFAVEPAMVTIEGDCQYQLNRPTRLEPLSSLGLSNVGHGEVLVGTNSPVFIFQGEAS